VPCRFSCALLASRRRRPQTHAIATDLRRYRLRAARGVPVEGIAWRWGVERIHSWFNRFRKLLVSFEKNREELYRLSLTGRCHPLLEANNIYSRINSKACFRVALGGVQRFLRSKLICCNTRLIRIRLISSLLVCKSSRNSARVLSRCSANQPRN